VSLIKIIISDTETQQRNISDITTTIVAVRKKVLFKQRLQHRIGFAKLSSISPLYCLFIPDEDYVRLFCLLLPERAESRLDI